LDFSIIEPKQEKPVDDLLSERLKNESSALLRTENSTSTYNKFSAVSAQASNSDSGFGSDLYGSASAFSDRVKREWKPDPADVVKTEGPDRTDEEESIEFLRALRRDW